MLGRRVFVSFSCFVPSSVTADGGDLDHWKAAVLMTVTERDDFVFSIQSAFSVFCDN